MMSADSDTNADTTNGQETGSAKKPLIKRIPVVGPAMSLYRSYSRRNGPLLSAGIAYYGLFALAPLMLLTLNVSGYIVGSSKAQQELSEALEAYLGPKMADVLSGVVANLQGGGSTFTTFIGAVIFLYAGTRLFLRLQVSFNVMWDIRTKWGQRSAKRLLSRAGTFGMILIPTLLLLVSLFLSTGISWLAEALGVGGWLLSALEALIPFLVGWVALVAIFTILPDASISWRDCWIGALGAAILWSVGARVFGAYLSWSTSQKYAGAVGALIALIVWVDFMTVIALLGARLSRLIYEWRGKTLRPYSFAEIARPEHAGNDGDAHTSDQADEIGKQGGSGAGEDMAAREVKSNAGPSSTVEIDEEERDGL